ncbi:hypothetical protein Pla175_40690 [Pirellulimonas nuda]|uniref:Uncharacterized protein n=1 Tax=Pirellulimonas nuda TaxID=2528009 RepID=A0A518DGQ5_9BACT|nr:hypothetical protein [Pirellulimonas nuda]QDU90660.1 hypothetical protein Pla175_40690 [Pirellulimonas nuda]
MQDTRSQYRSFQQYAEARLPHVAPEQSLADIFYDWLDDNPSIAQQAEDLAAIDASLQLMEEGDRGISPEELDAIIAKKTSTPSGA